MGKVLKYILGGIIVSCFLFHLTIRAIPVTNTKNMLAALGVVVLLVNLTRNRSARVDSDFFSLMLMAGFVSLAGLISIIYNNTPDTSYATYIVTAAVWLCSAYGTVQCLKFLNGDISIEVICKYVIWVCAAQCFFAQLFDMFPATGAFVDRFVETGRTFAMQKNRLYGIGAMLDPAGIRMAASLVMATFVIINGNSGNSGYRLPLYLFVFVWITITGNMIARTTTIGSAIGLVAMILFSSTNHDIRYRWNILKWAIGIILIAVPLTVFLYNTNPDFHHNMRFAFEGFFNYFERGQFETASTDVLQTMYVYPDNAKTWIIGDGYFAAAANDRYYVGNDIGQFYKNTDVGWLRLIFYFGLIGFGAFALFIAHSAAICTRRNPEYKWMFWLLVLLNYIIWLKVATDIFLIFALCLCADYEIGKAEAPENISQLPLQ